MESFLLFPPEIQTHVLWFLSQHELASLFELPNLLEKASPHVHLLVNPDENRKLQILQHQALYAMFYRKPLLLSNDFTSTSMPLCHLKHLLKAGVHIAPSELNIQVLDFTDFDGSFSLWDCFTPSLFTFLRQLNSKINIELVLWEKMPLEPSILRSWLNTLLKNDIKLASFKIKYSSSLGLPLARNNEIPNISDPLSEHRLIEAHRLHLNFCGMSEISRHLLAEAPWIRMENIRVLDLSYNQLTDLDLRSLSLPRNLKVLNLSNNSISIFDSECLHFDTLLELDTLDLSNNNIMRLDICHTNGHFSSPLRCLNLAGNFLSAYSSLFTSTVFANLQEVDFSHNLISSVTGFADSLKRVNLSGNYITAQLDSQQLSFSSNLEVLGIDQFLVDSVLDESHTQDVRRDALLGCDA